MKKNKQAKKKSVIERLNEFLYYRSDWIFAFSALLSAFIFFKLFDIRINIAGDDSTYIMSGYKFLKYGEFPTWHSPLYSIFLAIPIAFVGVSLPWLKITSAVFLLLSFYFFFKSYKGNINSVLLFLIVFIVAINFYIAYYASFTFSEAFFMFFQLLFIYYIFKFIDKPGNKLVHYIILGLLSVALYMAKTVGLAGIIAVLLFWGSEKKWKKLFFSFFSFTVFYFLVRIAKNIFWGISGNQFSSQLETLMQKDPYKAALGKEDFWGFFNRLIDNSNLYISKHFFRFLGLRPYDALTIEPVLTILFYGIILFALVYSFRKNKYIFFSIIYLGVFLGITFLSVQKVWDQDRLIVPVFPFMLLGIMYGLFELFRLVPYKFLKIIPYSAGAIILFLTMNVTSEKISENKDVLQASLAGNMYYGYNPDWENYLKMCAVAGEQLPDTALIACRKPGMAFIYGKKIFYGISTVTTTAIDSLVDENSILYAVPADDKTAQKFRREMIYGIFYGVPVSEEFAANKFYFLFESEEKLETIDQKYVINSSELKNSFSTLFLFSPDKLLKRLENSDVDYIISANLRAIPDKKTNRTITTVKRYMQIIRFKYPNVFRKVYEVGQDEKAELYRIIYPDI
jgi:hypothetical protein